MSDVDFKLDMLAFVMEISLGDLSLSLIEHHLFPLECTFWKDGLKLNM